MASSRVVSLSVVEAFTVVSSDMVSLVVKCSSGTKLTVTVELKKTVKEFKAQLQAEAGVPPEQMRIIYDGRVLKDHQTLASYHIQDGLGLTLCKSEEISDTCVVCGLTRGDGASQCSGESFRRGSDGKCTLCDRAEGDHFSESRSVFSPCSPACPRSPHHVYPYP